MNLKNSLDNSTVFNTADSFFKSWDAGQDPFALQTSGSTGHPSIIYRSRKALICSAETTGQVLEVTEKDHIYCCLPIDKTGGFMQLVRSKVWNVPITLHAPKLNPLSHFEGKGTIISVTPQQLHEILSDPQSLQSLNAFRIVLIGGGALSEQTSAALGNLQPTFYETYGMTETCSHIALRNVKTDTYFRVLPEIEIACAEDDTLRIRGCVTDNEWIQTHDRVEISPHGLRFLGRIDNIINSGGVKMQAESIEIEIATHYNLPVNSIAISSIPDKVLGDKIVLVIDKNTVPKSLNFEFDFLTHNHSKPRHLFWIDRMPLTETNKLKRTEIKNWVLQQRDPYV